MTGIFEKKKSTYPVYSKSISFNSSVFNKRKRKEEIVSPTRKMEIALVNPSIFKLYQSIIKVINLD
jgi:hypothetical protein